MDWMSLVQQLSTSLLLRKIYAIASRIPILGSALNEFTRTAIPSDTLVWTSIRSGPGKGLWLRLNPRYEMAYLEGDYEAPVEQILLSNLRPGTVFYDVGAHIGVFSLIAARNLGAHGSVFVFEPDPYNVRRIREHASRNQLDAIQIIPKAVCSTVGRLRFQRASFQSSMNRGVLVEDVSAGKESSIEVESMTLDAFAQEHGLPNLIKIDVEGSEAAVLHGSEEIFRSAKPLLVCEIHHEQASSDVTGWLRVRGYMFHWLESSTNFPRHLFAKYVGFPSDRSKIETHSSRS
jgi:FkbM family methyltransferase